MRILAISGSLRGASSNTSALQAAVLLAPRGVLVVVYDGLGNLPHFNPDLDVDEPPPAVKALREEVGRADGLLICSPEYAHGVPGSMKNALDWLVKSVEFPEKPVALINTSERARHADAHLRETLVTMSARLVGDTTTVVPLLGRNLNAEGIASDAELSGRLRQTLQQLMQNIESAVPASW